jgi:type IV pilus biogenesis protein CpaD/CtpE
MHSGKWKPNATLLAGALLSTLAGCATPEPARPTAAAPAIVETARPRLSPVPAWILEKPGRREANFRQRLEDFFAPKPTAPTK